MLLRIDPAEDPLLKPLSFEARSAWIAAVSRCDLFQTDIIGLRELEESDDDVTDAVVDEWEHAALAERLPFGNIRFLARGLLWSSTSSEARAA